MTTTEQGIIRYDHETDSMSCTCGNTERLDGFYTCTEQGVELEPTVGSGWAGHYHCAACGAIYNILARPT